ncbi:MAG: thioredoxin domain-containing protein [Urechidicola sp.]|nr:thioredoxin domain-containing protein [Urechidicola sp.]
MLENITSVNFKKNVLEATKPVLVEVYTNSCPNCKVLEPTVEETAKSNPTKFSFYKLGSR